ncbi:YbaN family protein [Aureimonas sp. AU4]|uniref:YbaN family protein n=1 Tax=Aureimonas sp. AU4 TaxID=1638163 RepID=UPI0009EC70AB|nr:YbaN family protein [Aureimonas sp. AU4]
MIASPPTPPEPAPPAILSRSLAARRFYKGLGLVFLGLAIAGIVLPGLPATPFALLGAWAFRRGSPEWAARLDRDPRFGPALRAWRERRAVSRRAKTLAVVSMAASYALLWASGASGLVLGLVAATLILTSSYLLSRPSA